MGWPHHHHHHDHHHRKWRPLGPIGRFVRAQLRRRIFVWFLLAILSTGILVFGVVSLIGRIDQPEWVRTFDRTRGWFGAQFAPSWSDPATRTQFAKKTAEELEADIDLFDEQGHLLVQTGQPCLRPMFEAPVRSAGVMLGQVRLCMDHRPGGGLRGFLFFGIALGAVWIVSGRVARRLARPLDDLTQVVKRIGQGDLKARTDLQPGQPDELGVVADAVNDMAARIEKQLAEHRELLATVSHELRTPLARLRLISEIARDTGATPRTYDDLDLEIAQLDALVGELLASSRLEFGQVNKRPLSIREVTSTAVERAGLNPTVHAVIGEADSLSADPTLLHRALANLFDNARKHGNGADAFEVTVNETDVRFEVLDRGPGITGDGTALFEKFNRGQNGQGADGLGLGLALVKRIAVAHGGEAWALPRDGGGARIGFSFKRS